MTKPALQLYLFLQAVKGNWRNSIFIECNKCPYGNLLCNGFLLAMDSEGKPLLISADEFRRNTTEEVQKNECLSVLRSSDFNALYSLWICWQVESSKECAIIQLIRKQTLQKP